MLNFNIVSYLCEIFIYLILINTIIKNPLFINILKNYYIQLNIISDKIQIKNFLSKNKSNYYKHK